ncbi:hypothetical protein Tco_1577016 [Tanacetum coccineum]
MMTMTRKFYSLNDTIISGLPSCVAITSALSTEKPVDSLLMEDEHLNNSGFGSANSLCIGVENFSTPNPPPPTPNEVSQIDDEVLESITSIPPGIDSFNAESDLIESLLNQDTSI